MKLQSILCPVDFSSTSEAAVQYASLLAADTGATLHLLHVVDESAIATTGHNGVGYIADMAEQLEGHGLEQLQAMTPLVSNVPFDTCQLVGVPARSILEYAHEKSVDLIVMGSHGRSGLARLLMGSVAEAVVRRADCPVLTVKHPMVLVDAAQPTHLEAGKAVP